MKRILITGGTGSLGQHLIEHYLSKPGYHVTVYSRDEEKQRAVLDRFNNNADRLALVIGDVRDYGSLLEAVRGHDVVINAAALKQIPACEANVWETIRTNIHGARNVVEACASAGVPTVLQVSTDKAVNPLNLYGMSKAVAERIFVDSWRRTGRKIMCVRYGNVLGSRGSVVPLFKRLVESGQQITITSRDMTRFILPLSAAISLIETALTFGNGGEIFVPVIKSVNIADLALTMIAAGGSKSGMSEIGIRQGEKIHEVLISEEEQRRTMLTQSGRVAVILPEQKADGRQGLGATGQALTSNNAEKFTEQEIIDMLRADGLLPGRLSQ